MKWLLILCLFLCSCVKVTPPDLVVKLYGLTGTGTGFYVIAPSGRSYILTNRHVCATAPLPFMLIKTGEKYYPIPIIEQSNKSDLCLLASPERKGFKLAKHDPNNDDKVDIWGFGLQMPLQHTEGRFVGLFDLSLVPPNDRDVHAPWYVTATTLPGNSGSPVLNENKEVIGIAWASGEDIAFRTAIVPLSDIKEFLQNR